MLGWYIHFLHFASILLPYSKLSFNFLKSKKLLLMCCFLGVWMIVQYLEISLSVFKIIFQWSVDVFM